MITVYFVSIMLVCSDGKTSINNYFEGERNTDKEVVEYLYKLYSTNPYIYPTKDLTCKATNVQFKSEQRPNL